MEGMETASPGAATAAPTPDERRQRVFGWLDARGIAYTWYEHPEAPTIEAARRYWRDDGSKHCKNLFFRNHKGNRHYLVCFDCERNLAIHDLEHRLRQGKLSFASEQRMERWLGLRPGSVSPFGRINDPARHVHLFLDASLQRLPAYSCHPNDKRSDCYGIGDIAQIAVKRNALELLPAELRARRKKRATIGTGSMNDPYMPVERELRLTRRALGMIADERFPVHVITKSSLAERDADILQEISATYAAVSFTVTCADDALSVRTEPGAPASSERFRAMAALAAKGIYTGVTMMPLLPLINDTRENVEAIVRRAKDAGASYILPMFGVTLRSGSREHFHATLDREFPGLKARYEACFGNRYECFSPSYRKLNDTFRNLCAKLGLETRMRFYAPTLPEQGSLF